MSRYLLLIISLSFTSIQKVYAEDINPESIKSNGGHTCVLFSNKKLKCWGRNDFGQLGYGHKNNIGDELGEMGQNLPFLSDSVELYSLGTRHTCIINSEKVLKCFGKLTENHDLKEEIALEGEVQQLEAGLEFSCLLFTSGKLKCFGSNSFGRFGVNKELRGASTYKNAMYTKVSERIVYFSISNNTCYITESGKSYCLGENLAGELGQGNSYILGYYMDTNKPIEHGSQFPVVRTHSDYTRNCLEFSNQSLKCFGNNFAGSFGIEAPDMRIGLNPTDMGENLKEAMLPDIKRRKLLINGAMNCYLTEKNSTLFCFGSNYSRSLGFTHAENIGDETGEMGQNLSQVDFGVLTLVDDFSIGQRFGCAIYRESNSEAEKTKKVKCWGETYYGQLGNPRFMDYADNYSLSLSELPPVEL